MKNLMQFNRPIFSCLLILTLTAGGAVCISAAQSEPDNSDNQQFSSVEERRLHVKIIEEHDSLDNQRKALLLKEQTLKDLEADIDRKLDEIDEKLAELEKQKRALENLLVKKDEAEQRRLQNLGKVYESMIPVQAARALSKLDVETAADILAAMGPRSAAKIINGFSADKASEITRKLISGPGP
jgi:flagellar motility protein MotE (MotC chaperone)